MLVQYVHSLNWDLRWSPINSPPSADECENSLLVSNSAHTSFCTVKVKHPNDLTIRKKYLLDFVASNVVKYLTQERELSQSHSYAFTVYYIWNLKLLPHVLPSFCDVVMFCFFFGEQITDAKAVLTQSCLSCPISFRQEERALHIILIATHAIHPLYTLTTNDLRWTQRMHT